MNPAAWASFLVALSGLLAAVTALISAVRAHQRITAGQGQQSDAGGSSASGPSPRP